MWIKICGIRDVETADAIARLGADALGLNFYAESPRRVRVDVARQIGQRLPDGVEGVGVFVNASASEVRDVAGECGLTTLQIHGDEPPEFLAALKERVPSARLIRAYRLESGPGGILRLADYLEECGKLGVELAACLIDAHVAGEYGGTGRVVSWETLGDDYRREDWPPMIVAGGLTAENVAEAIRAALPWGVDVAGGVESSPAVKDLEKVQRFIAAARGER